MSDAAIGTDGKIELTPMQMGMVLSAGSPGANLEQVCAHLPGIRADDLRAAWHTLAQRHDALRLSVTLDGDGLPVAQIHAEAAVDFRTPQAPLPMQAALAQHLAQDRACGLGPDTDSPALWRVALLGEGREDATMVWTIHHALVDAESMALVLRDLGHLLRGEGLPLPPPSLAEALAQIAQPEAAAHIQLSQYMENAPEPALLAPAPPQSAPARRQVLRAKLGGGLAARLSAQARDLGGTPLNMVQAAWGITLSRWCGHGDVVMGLVGSGRASLPLHRETVGCLINTLPLRVSIGAQTTPRRLIEKLRTDTLMLRTHEHFPAARLGHGPLFDCVLMYTGAALPARLAELDPWWRTRAVTLHEEGSAPVTLAVYNGTELLVELEHDPLRLPQAAAQRMMAGFCALLESLSSAAGNVPLEHLPMLTAEESSALRALGEPQRPAQPPVACIWRWLQAQDGARPAVISDAGTLSHAQLAQSAENMARHLAAAGLGAGDIVALALPRSPEFVVAMLAVLRLGAAFLPLDAAFPQGAVERMLADSGAKALLATKGRARPAGFGGIVLDLPTGSCPHPLPDLPPLDPARGAYVIFTSGSTGRPKAVLGLVGALCAHAQAAIDAFALTPQDRVLQFAGLSFDVMLEEVFPTLLAGGAVVLRDEESAGSIERLLALSTRQRVSVANLPASFWAVLVDAAEAGTPLPPSLRLMISGSEKIDARMLARWRAVAPELGFINGYGPTETTITATALRLAPGEPLPEGDVPIGRPMGHARAQILAPDGSLTPHGQIGMLWIGGPAVTGGYLNAAEATAQRFAPDPHHLGAQRYNTGDRARWRADGQIEFLGREDRQIKLRGFRIDLQQIEEELRALPGLKQAHVGLRSDTGTQRLIGWVQADEGHSADIPALHQMLAATLAAHMLPELVAVDSFPTTPNGKIDTAALPTPAVQVTPESGPVDPLTQRIADLMATTLSLESVDVDASFSALGGDSLSALKLAALIDRQTSHTVNATDLYSHPTARALAEMLLQGSGRPRFIVPIQPNGTGTIFFAVHVLGRREELYTPLAAALGPERPVLGLTVGVPKSMDEIDVQRTADLYFNEIQTHHPEGPIALGAVSMAAYFAFELAQRLLAAGRDVRLLAIFDAAGPDGRESLGTFGKIAMHLRLLRQRGPTHVQDILNRRRKKRKEQEALRTMDPDALKIENLVSANVEAVNSYQPQPYPRLLTIFRADQSIWDSPRAIRTGLGWASVAGGGVEVLDVPGDHLTILAAENVQAVAHYIAQRLDRPVSSQPTPR